MIALLAAALAAAQPAAAVSPLPEGQALTSAIAARDAEFFQLLFLDCDPGRMSAMLAADFEMYHDRDGLVATDAGAFVALYQRMCEARRAPDAWRSRRELLSATLNVHPVPGFGAIEDGEHQFYERRGDGPERLVGHARFTQVWKLAPDGWRLSRVFSYAHRPAGEGN
jgi:hypothetical protein